MVSQTRNRRIETRGVDGPNGFLVPIWHVDSGQRVDQVYLTVVNPGCVKGPHLHKIRSGRFTCIKGDALIVVRGSEEWRLYMEYWTGESHNYSTVTVVPGLPAAIYCLGNEPAYVLNMPSPAWRENEPDEWPVENWDFKNGTFESSKRN